MKKIIVFVLTFFASCLVVNADVKGDQVHKVACSYSTGNLTLKINYVYDNTHRLYIDSLDYRIGNVPMFNFDSSNYTYAWDAVPTINTFYPNFESPLTNNISYNTEGVFIKGIENDEAQTSLCPTNFYVATEQENDEFKATFYACGTWDDENECSKISNYVKEAEKGKGLQTINFYTGLHTIEGRTDGAVNNNAQDVYNEVKLSLEEAQELEEEYCSNDYISTNGREDCDEISKKVEELEEQVGMATDNAEDLGYTEEMLDAAYSSFKNNLKWEEGGCASYLGHIDDPNAPAYYLKFAFNLIKYAAIVLLFVLTIVEFAKAVASSKDDAIKKASQNTVKRLIIAVIIFFLPILINFVFDILGIVETDPTCNIINADTDR